MLETVTGIKIAFCKYVSFNNKMFFKDSKIHIQLTVSWSNNYNPSAYHSPSSSWSENVTETGFKVCVLVAGRPYLRSIPNPTVFWVAYQEALINSSQGKLYGGSVDMKTWYTGTNCHNIYYSVCFFCLLFS